MVSGKFKELSNELSLAFWSGIVAEKIVNVQKNKQTNTQTNKKNRQRPFKYIDMDEIHRSKIAHICRK